MTVIVDLILFIFAVIGMTHIMVDSDMLLVKWLRDKIQSKLNAWQDKKTNSSSSQGGDPPARWSKVLECYQCCGTWCGFFCGALLIVPWPDFPMLFQTYSVAGAIAFSMWCLFQTCLWILLCGFAGSFVAQWGIHQLERIQAEAISYVDN